MSKIHGPRFLDCSTLANFRVIIPR
jgi:hypothetical protein